MANKKGMKQETKLKYDHVCSLTLSQPRSTLQELSTLTNTSESQVAYILQSRGIRKQKGTAGHWEITGEVKIRSYIPHPRKPLPYNRQTKNLYLQMIQRCYNPNHPNYKNWGGRGITVCDHWLGKEGFAHFFQDKGNPPPGKTSSGKRAFYTLERRNNNLGYSKENTYWGTWLQQARNRRPRLAGSRTSLAIAREIRTLHQQEIPREETIKKYNISKQIYSQIIYNRIWREEKYK